MRYVLSQLCEKIMQYTESHHLYKSAVFNLYYTADKILKDLKKIYEDLDKSQNYYQIYIEFV